MDAAPTPEYKLPQLDYDALINRLVTNNSSFDYAIRLLHRSKLTSEESEKRLKASLQYVHKISPNTIMLHETDMKSQKRRRGVYNSTGVIFPEARAAMFLPPTSG